MLERRAVTVFALATLLFAAVLPGKAFAQSRFSKFGFWTFDLQGGMVIPNDPGDSPVLGNTAVYTVNIGIGGRMVGPQYWKNYLKNPYFGLKIGFDRIDNSVVGNRASLAAYIEQPFARTRHWDFGFMFAFGLSYLEKTYDSVGNPQNMFIGSHLNALINLGLTANWHVTDKLTMYSSINFTHSSNGTIQLPNKGVNIAQLELGAKVNFHPYSPQDMQPPATLVATSGLERKNSVFINFSPVYNSSRKSWEHYFSTSMSVGYRRKFHPCFAYGAGVDLMYDASLEQAHEPNLPENNYAVSGYGLLEAYWGRFSLRGAVGYYAWRGCDFALPFYERIGVYYNITKHQYIGASIKAHAAHAQFLEWTYGVALVDW